MNTFDAAIVGRNVWCGELVWRPAGEEPVAEVVTLQFAVVGAMDSACLPYERGCDGVGSQPGELAVGAEW